MGQNDDKIQPHILQRYQIVKKIGCGAYGVVWKVIDKKTKTVHALKKNFDAFQNSTDAQRTYRQVMFLQQVNHPNIISLQKILKSQNQKDIYLVFQFMDIDLYTLIRENILQQKHKRYIIYQTAKSIYYLHTGDLIHRDIKPSNILVNQNCLAKMCDFGLVRSVDSESQGEKQEQEKMLTQYIATRWYRAPEILLGSKKYAKAVDVWSFGCLIGEIIKGRPMFPGNSTLNQIQRVLTWTGAPTLSDMKALKTDFGKQMLQLLSKIKKVPKTQWFPNISNSAFDLLSKTLQFNPQKRITMLQVLQHPYLREFYNQQQLIQAQSKIRIPIDDNKKLGLKDYRSLIYKLIKDSNQDIGNNGRDQYDMNQQRKDHEILGSLKNSIAPSKSVIVSKKTANYTSQQKESPYHPNNNNLTRQLRDTNKTIHKNRIYKGNTFVHTSTQKTKVHSLGTSNKSIHKKLDDMHNFKKNLGNQIMNTGVSNNNKKYESLLNNNTNGKKKQLISSTNKTKHIRTQGESNKDEYMYPLSTSFYPPGKYQGGNSNNNHNNNNDYSGNFNSSQHQTNARMFGSADKSQKQKKKAVLSLNQNRRQSEGIAKYMYKHKYF